MPVVYEILIQGYLDPCWSEWLEGLTITQERCDTLLRGPLPDQAALYGLLNRLCDMNLTLVWVRQVESGYFR